MTYYQNHLEKHLVAYRQSIFCQDIFSTPRRDRIISIIRGGGGIAQAQRVVVALEAEGDTIRLSIADDGTGTTEEREGHYGLTGMRERAAMAGARLGVASAPGQGTRVTVDLPHASTIARATRRAISTA
jgi:hypothetical protein